ncbi:tachykinin-like peptides receptor 99D [Dendronephthya gigantea]|uniref:tachykinin-like peptides receptor 99D n=1 Tax=Dendronephthya gigantea TaxID=151771 RepID=UPI00106D5F5D|nr:tachykinin-like peptides receptor 99D [Dendronephthya gigantea]
MVNLTTVKPEDDTSPDRLPLWTHILALILYVVLFILAVFGNALALWILRMKPELRTLTHAFLTNLVIADLLLALLTPLEAVATFSATYVLGDYGCKIQRTSLYFFYAASILTLTAISLERYVAICYPIQYDDFKKRKTRIIAFIWFASAFLIIPHVYLSEERTLDGESVCFQFHTTDKTRAPFFFLPCFLLLYLFPLAMVSVTYWKSARKLMELENRLEVNSIGDVSLTVRMRKEVLRMLLVVIVFFVIQWTPFEIVEILDSAPGVMDVNPISSRRVAVNMLAFSNAVVNPILFGFMSKPFRDGFKESGLKIIRFICCSSGSQAVCCSCCCNRFSFVFYTGSNANLTSSTPDTSTVRIDWDSSFSKLENPVTIVENELVAFQELPDGNAVPDHKL